MADPTQDNRPGEDEDDEEELDDSVRYTQAINIVS